MTEPPKSPHLHSGSEATPSLADALIHFFSCLAMSFVFVPYGFKLSDRGDFTTAKTYHAGGVLMVAGVSLFFVAIGGLGWLPTGRWRSWRQPLVLACWVLAGALLAGLLELCSNGTCCTGSAWDLSIDILTWTWLPSFWLVKLLTDRFLDKRNPSLK
jgi:hypothetical protein